MADDEIHVLDPDEQVALRTVERSMVLRAALVGAGSGMATAVAEVLAQPFYDAELGYLDNATYWAIVGGVAIAVTVLEVVLLYVDSLGSVHEIARKAGVPIFSAGGKPEMTSLATALTRAAMELPNPPDTSSRIDVYRETSKWQLAVASLVYKLKVSATNIVLKVVLRRMVGRSALKVYLEFVAAPVYAFWNGWVAWRVIREARLRAMGPSAAHVFASRSSCPTRTPMNDWCFGKRSVARSCEPMIFTQTSARSSKKLSALSGRRRAKGTSTTRVSF